MMTNEELERRLHDLGEVLRRRPSFADVVMARMATPNADTCLGDAVVNRKGARTRRVFRLALPLAGACLVAAVVFLLGVRPVGTALAYGEVSRALDKKPVPVLRGLHVDEELVGHLRRFRDAYSLGPDENLKLIVPPFMPERKTYIAWKRAEEMVRLPELPVTRAPDWMTFKFSNGTLRKDGECYGSYRLTGIVNALGIGRSHLQGADELVYAAVPGDLIYRPEATRDDKVDELERALRSQLNWDVSLELRRVERDVLVADGLYEYKGLPDYAEWHFNTIEMYGSRQGECHGGSTGDIAEFLGDLGDFIGTPVVVGAIAQAPERVQWRYGWKPRGYKHQWAFPLPANETELVLGHVTEQTGLTFHTEQRQIQVLFVEGSLPPAR